MGILRFSTAVRTAMAQAVAGKLDAGAGPALLKFYTGTMPASANTAVGGGNTLLGTLTCSDPCGSVSGDTLTFGAITLDTGADATGTATWARLTDSDGNAVADFDVTDTAGSGSIKLNSVDVYVGGPIAMTSLTITMG